MSLGKVTNLTLIGQVLRVSSSLLDRVLKTLDVLALLADELVNIDVLIVNNANTLLLRARILFEPRTNRLGREATFLHSLLHICMTSRQELLLVGISGLFERYYLVCMIFRSFFFFGVFTVVPVVVPVVLRRDVVAVACHCFERGIISRVLDLHDLHGLVLLHVRWFLLFFACEDIACVLLCAIACFGVALLRSSAAVCVEDCATGLKAME